MFKLSFWFILYKHFFSQLLEDVKPLTPRERSHVAQKDGERKEASSSAEEENVVVNPKYTEQMIHVESQFPNHLKAGLLIQLNNMCMYFNEEQKI